jgi:hypothetical protein
VVRKHKRGTKNERTHTGCRTRESIHNGTFTKAEVVEENILGIIGDDVVDVDRLQLGIALYTAIQLVSSGNRPLRILSVREKHESSIHRRLWNAKRNLTTTVRILANGKFRPV